jgi:hypothetical protein
MRFKVGDLVKYGGRYIDELPWLIVDISKTKKTWRRNYLLYRNGDFLLVNYRDFKWSALLSGERK